MAGNVITIKDIVIRVQFDDDFPEVNELIKVENGHDTELLVDHLEPGGIAFCLNIRSDLRVMKGEKVSRLHKGIEIPIGEKTIGRVLNALGDHSTVSQK
jgi:F-type H+-transporting ATPase subunit beta